MHPLPWTNLLLSLRHELEALTDARFNSVLLNLYRDQNDRMGFHSDNEPSLGLVPTVASLSYGATRTLIFKHKKLKSLERKRVPLTSGSLLLRGPTQRNWDHGLIARAQPCGPRINLTFRNILKLTRRALLHPNLGHIFLHRRTPLHSGSFGFPPLSKPGSRAFLTLSMLAMGNDPDNSPHRPFNSGRCGARRRSAASPLPPRSLLAIAADCAIGAHFRFGVRPAGYAESRRGPARSSTSGISQRSAK